MWVLGMLIRVQAAWTKLRRLRTVGLIVAVAFRSPGTKITGYCLWVIETVESQMVWVVSVYSVECAVLGVSLSVHMLDGSYSKFWVQWCIRTSDESFSILRFWLGEEIRGGGVIVSAPAPQTECKPELSH